jgi:hypothetical protein
MGLVDKITGRTRKLEKLPEGGKRVTVTNKKGGKKEIIKGKNYRAVTKTDKLGRETLSKERSGKKRSKIETKYNDFSDKASEVKVTNKKGLFGKKKVREAKFKKDNRDFFGK